MKHNITALIVALMLMVPAFETHAENPDEAARRQQAERIRVQNRESELLHQLEKARAAERARRQQQDIDEAKRKATQSIR